MDLFSKISLAGHLNEETISLVAFICWFIWKGRNNFIFNGTIPNPIFTLNQAYNAHAEYFAAQAQNFIHQQTNSALHHNHYPSSWIPPPHNHCKLNTDASFLPSLKGAIGIICRNHNGVVIHGQAKNLSCSSPLQAEGLAVLQACHLCSSLNLENPIIEMDSEILFKALCSSSYAPPVEIHHIVEDIHCFSHAIPQVSFALVCCEGNKAADWIVKSCMASNLPFDWLSNTPSGLSNILLSDFSLSGIG